MPSGLHYIAGGILMAILIPQMPTSIADPLLIEMAEKAYSELEPVTELRHPQAITLPTGGLPVSEAMLRELRESVVTAARNHGFPGRRPASFLGFELEVAESLADWAPLWDKLNVPSGEALRNDSWTFITIVILPDVALWRWPPKADQGGTENRAWKGRMLGGSRNTFQRIFRRVMCLDRGIDHPDRWGLIRELQEDDFSAILERPGLSSNRNIAISLGEEYLAMKDRLRERSADARQTVYRQATKAIRAYGVVQPLDLMTAETRQQLIHDAFSRYETDVVRMPGGERKPAAPIDTAQHDTAQSEPIVADQTRPRNLLRRLFEGG